MAKKSFNGKRYFEWLGIQHEINGVSELLYMYYIKKWPLYADRAYRMARYRLRFENQRQIKSSTDEKITSKHIYYRVR